MSAAPETPTRPRRRVTIAALWLTGLCAGLGFLAWRSYAAWRERVRAETRSARDEAEAQVQRVLDLSAEGHRLISGWRSGPGGEVEAARRRQREKLGIAKLEEAKSAYEDLWSPCACPQRDVKGSHLYPPEAELLERVVEQINGMLHDLAKDTPR